MKPTSGAHLLRALALACVSLSFLAIAVPSAGAQTVERVTLLVPAQPTVAQAETTIRAAAALVRGGLAPSAITVAMEDAKSGPAKSDTEPRIDITTISDPSAVARQLVGASGNLEVPDAHTNVVTLGELGYEAITFSSNSTEQIISVAQADVGGRASNWQLHLRGTHTGRHRLTVIVSGTTILATELRLNRPEIDVVVPIPAAFVGRQLEATIRIEGDSGGTAIIETNSSLSFERSDTQLSGFQQWPQVALPTATLVFAKLNGASLSDATRLWSLLQAETRRELPLSVSTDIKTRPTTPSVYFLDGVTPSFLDVPIVPGIRLLDDRNSEMYRIDDGESLTSLQSIEVDGHEVLVLSAPNEAESSALLLSVATSPDRWRWLVGDVWFSASGRPYVAADTQGSGPKVVALGATGPSFVERNRVLIGLLVMAVVVLATALTVPRIVRPPLTRNDPDARPRHLASGNGE